MHREVSIRKSLACFRDPNAVVGEVAVHLWNINLHHMTTCASLGRDRTGWTLMAGGFDCPRRVCVAFQACSVIGCGVRLQLLVRVMAGGTRKPCISFSPAFTCDQAVGRRSRAGHAFNSSEFHIPPGAVTRATEINRIRGIKTSGVEDG